MEELKLGKIGVLMGGPSSEREISLKSGHAVLEALLHRGVNALPIDITTDAVEENIALIRSYNIECAFLALHGRFGEDGAIQEILETIRLPYTGSGVEASRLAMDKIASRRLFEREGLHVPRYEVLYRPEWKGDTGYTLPLVVKPATHGSSIGLSIVDAPEQLPEAVERAFQFDERVLMEEYIPGREITVGILNDEALPVIEIVPKKKFFDYEAKYKPGMTEYVVPAQLEKEIFEEAQRVALSAYRILGCFGCSRVDMLLDREGVPFVLELNSIPGMTPTSLLPKAAKVAGIDFAQLCIILIKLAYERTKASLPR